MIQKIEPTYRIDIFLAGDEAVIAQACREQCYAIGLCVTVEKCRYVYTGGEEAGVRVGILNYPRFPKTSEELNAQAEVLALRLMEVACQHSVLLVGPHETRWITRRDAS